MLKVAIALTSLVVVVSAAIGIGSKLASGKSEIEFVSGPRISPLEIMLKFDMSQPAEEIKDPV